MAYSKAAMTSSEHRSISRAKASKTITKARREIYASLALVLTLEILMAVLFQRSELADDWLMGVVAASLPLMIATIASFGFILLMRPRSNAVATAVSTAVIVFFVYFALLVPLGREDQYAVSLIAFALTLSLNNIVALTVAKTTNLRVGLLDPDGVSKIQDTIGQDLILIHDVDAISDLDMLVFNLADAASLDHAQALSRAFLSGVEVMHWARFLELRKGRVDIKTFDPSVIVYSSHRRLYFALKRLIDMVAAVFIAPITLLVVFLACVYVYFIDGGPVFYVQTRKGLGGKLFRMFKIRTMTNAPIDPRAATVKNDQRVIRGGHFLRRYRIDELPQMLNVLLGDMSIIGCRPEAVFLAERYEAQIPEYALRCLIRPGITGWAQVKYRYVNTVEEVRTRLSYDLFYVKNASLELDLRIAVKTVKTLLFGRGAL